MPDVKPPRETFREVVTAYERERVITALSLDGKRRYGARYEIQVDGVKIALATWIGGRWYRITDDGFDVRDSWDFITPDGGKVADVARYMGWCHLNSEAYVG